VDERVVLFVWGHFDAAQVAREIHSHDPTAADRRVPLNTMMR
jgi:hypothetical protein